MFAQILVFEIDFEDHGWFLSIFQKIVCRFYGNQNECLNLMVSTQKSVWKTNQAGPRYLQKCFVTWGSKPNWWLKTVFDWFLKQYWVFLETDFYIETKKSVCLFWVPLKLQTDYKYVYKIWLCTSKWSKIRSISIVSKPIKLYLCFGYGSFTLL